MARSDPRRLFPRRLSNAATDKDDKRRNNTGRIPVYHQVRNPGGDGMRNLRALLCVMAAVLTSPAWATFHTFGLSEFFSNADGSVQFVVLQESVGMNGQNLLAGHMLTSTSTHGAGTHAFTFNKELANGNTASKFVLIATQGFANLGIVTPDYIVPAGFLFTDGGTVNYASVDQATYAALPTDGVTALSVSGATIQNLATNFAGATGTVPAAGPATVPVIEYYNQGLDHYFMTASPSDISALDGGQFFGWARTGETFKAYPTQVLSTVPVCRFFIPPEHGSSHFFSAKASDCAALLAAAADPAHNPSFSGYIEEDAAAFYITPPDATGNCPTGTVPVFRLWNQRFDSNHRYTTSQAIVVQMQARNFVIEGDPPGLASMCAPS
jgi:hypothetical protein